ncbi:MAG: hypothetical protein JSV52_15280 [Candidatus Zixiibacteriota bacterium]|nr:MAG: hypothetical protein JSV52_15280 [candidate division Zixibacteria bacterium]
MKRNLTCGMLLLSLVLAAATFGGDTPDDVRQKLLEWRKGVWVSGGGTYTVWTAKHYFVISYTGDSTRPNVYFGASQVEFHSKGIARQQVVRYRKPPAGDVVAFRESNIRENHTEQPMATDTSLFTPGTCNIKDGIIYDAVTEVTDEYVLLATCNDDKVKLFSNGVEVYMPAGGGAFYSYRVEEL